MTPPQTSPQKMSISTRFSSASMSLTKRILNLTSTASIVARAAAPSSVRAAAQTRAKHYSRDIRKDTPRHELDDGSLFIHRNKPTEQVPVDSLPAIRGRWEKRFPQDSRLSPEQVKEMRELRASDPDTWTAMALAKKYQVPPTVVMGLAPLHPLSERRVRLRDEEDLAFSRLRLNKKVTIVDRIRRKAKW